MPFVTNYNRVIKRFPLSFNDLYELIGIHRAPAIITHFSDLSWRCIYTQDSAIRTLKGNDFSKIPPIPFDLFNLGDGFIRINKLLGIRYSTHFPGVIEDENCQLYLNSPYKLRVSVPDTLFETSFSILLSILLSSPVVIGFKIPHPKKFTEPGYRTKFSNKGQFTIYLKCGSQRTESAVDLLPPRKETMILIQNIEQILFQTGVPPLLFNSPILEHDSRINFEYLNEFFPIADSAIESMIQFQHPPLLRYVTGRYDNNYALLPGSYFSEEQLSSDINLKNACELAFREFINHLTGDRSLRESSTSTNQRSFRILNNWHSKMIHAFKAYEEEILRMRKIEKEIEDSDSDSPQIIAPKARRIDRIDLTKM